MTQKNNSAGNINLTVKIMIDEEINNNYEYLKKTIAPHIQLKQQHKRDKSLNKVCDDAIKWTLIKTISKNVHYASAEEVAICVEDRLDEFIVSETI